jgi:hypothetical protein
VIESDRMRIAMLLTGKLSVRTITPDDDDYTGTRQEQLERRDQHVVEGIAEAAEELEKELDLLLRLNESAERRIRIARAAYDALIATRPQTTDLGAELLLRIFAFTDTAQRELTAAIALLREGKVPEKMMEGAG